MCIRVSVVKLTAVDWRKSTFCDTSACVEVGPVGDQIALRDSKDPDGPVLRFTRQEWTAFVAGVGAGEFTFD